MGIKEKVLEKIKFHSGIDYIGLEIRKKDLEILGIEDSDFIKIIDLTVAEAEKENALEWRDFFKECGVMENIGVDRKKLIIDKLRETGGGRK